MLLSGFLILLTDVFSRCFLSIRSGPGQSDSINWLIQLTVIQLSGGHCIMMFGGKDNDLNYDLNQFHFKGTSTYLTAIGFTTNSPIRGFSLSFHCSQSSSFSSPSHFLLSSQLWHQVRESTNHCEHLLETNVDVMYHLVVMGKLNLLFSLIRSHSNNMWHFFGLYQTPPFLPCVIWWHW